MPVKTAPRRQTALCPTPRVIPESKLLAEAIGYLAAATKEESSCP